MPQYERILQHISQAGNNYLVLGDFNVITDEKEGGRMKSAESINGFNSFINKGNLMDLGFVGYEFTWSNRSYDGNLVKERIDRTLTSVDWCANYPKARLLHLEDNGSDHCPILLKSNPPSQRKKRRFKFQER